MMQTVFGDRTLYDLFGSQTSSDDRKYGIALLASRQALIEETIKLPTDWDGRRPAGSRRTSTGRRPRLKFEMREVTGCGIARTRASWQGQDAGLIPPDEYENYKEVIEKFEELSNHMITCEAEGSRA